MSSSRPASGWRLGSEDGARVSHLQVFSSQGQIKNHLSHAEARELACLGREKNHELLFAGLGAFAHRLEGSGKTALAAEIYQAIGRESRSGFAETWLVSLAKTATDYRTILPMLAGSAVYQTTRSLALNRLLSTPSANLLTRGFGARAASALSATAFEVPTFTLLSRAMGHSSEENIARDMASAGIVLGMMKLTGWAGSLASSKLSLAAGFAGLLSAHKIEESLGLRGPTNSSNEFINAFGTLIALRVGASLGQKILGTGFLKFQSELTMRTNHNPTGSQPPFRIWQTRQGLFEPATSPITGLQPGLIPAGRDSAAPPRLLPLLNENHSKDGPNPKTLSASNQENDLEKAIPPTPFGENPQVFREIVALTKSEDGTVVETPPPAHLVKLGGRRIWTPSPLRLVGEILLAAAAFAAFPIATAVGILGARYLIRKLGPELHRRILELKASLGEPNTKRLLLSSGRWRSATYREDPEFFERVEEIEGQKFFGAKDRAAEMGMDFALYLARRLQDAEARELEAWLAAMYSDRTSMKVSWIRRSQNPSGYPLLLDIAEDPAGHAPTRKDAINALAALDVADSWPIFWSLLKDPYLRYAAAGGLLWLNPDINVTNEIYTRAPIDIRNHDNFATWTESFYNLRHEMGKQFTWPEQSNAAISSFLHLLEKEARIGHGDRTLVSHLAYYQEIRDRLLPELHRNYEKHYLRPFVLEALIDAGFRELVMTHIGVDFRQENPDLTFAFQEGGKKTALRDLEPEALSRWARVAGKLGFVEEARKFLVWQERKLKRTPEPDPKAILSLAEAFIMIGEFNRTVPWLKPLLHHQEMNISFRAAELLDRAQPGWDERSSP